MSGETGYAKINLALHVRRRRPDGYHDIETLFAFAEDGDRIEEAGHESGLIVTGPFAAALEGGDPEQNLIMRATRELMALLCHSAMPAITLDKRLPVAAGIGGGSADAAAALRLLCGHHGVAVNEPRILRLAADLGADVPACLASVAVRGDGRGDQLTPVPAAALTGMPLLLVNPCVPLATGPVFASWDGRDRGALPDDSDPLAAALAGRNDLELPALELCPPVADVLALLRAQPGAVLTRMSGSGATCFALFDSESGRDAANQAVAAVRPQWWRLASRLR